MICGIDEAGRGPLAGPVSAAAVVLPPDFPFDVLDDSKKLNAERREEARILIYRRAAAWGVGWASAAEIDEVNILRAALLAMKRAYEAMVFNWRAGKGRESAGLSAVVDGLYVPRIPIPCTAVVRADASVPEVMAASILAKTARDRMMERYSWFYPEYGYERHMGYPTKEHRALVMQYGPSPIQRMSFKVSGGKGAAVRKASGRPD
ncbi:MAG: ribonuclease HII [Treponema sp.]|nr:ribonuclease HII [Treponema sp.]